VTSRLPSVCFIAPNAFPLLSGDFTTARIGGAELQVVIVARLLASRGWRISMVCLDYGQKDYVEIDGIKVYRAFDPAKGWPVVRFLWPRLISIWQCLKQADSDVYYQQTAGMLTGVMAAFCRVYGRRSVFASASNPDLLNPTPRIRFARDRFIYAFGMRRVDKVFVQNEEQADLCELNYGRNSIIVRNCYSPPATEPVTSDIKRVLWVSTIRKVKRPEIYLELAELMPQTQFVMIGGPGADEFGLYQHIQNRARSLKNLEFLGFQAFACTEREFDRTHLFVNTSESEGVPNSFLQAWARGIPTVSFIDAGARLNSKKVGVIVQDRAQMIGAIKKLLDDVQLHAYEGSHAREYVLKNHAPEAVIPVYEREFCDLVSLAHNQLKSLI
jgi:glycosyltransferase involved in cell wall biosynthesis